MKQFYERYFQEYNANPTSIVEIGSRDGRDADILRQYAELDPKSVYIAEAHPDCAKNIRLNYPEMNLFQVAIFDRMGILDFNAIDITYNEGYVGTSSLFKRNMDFVPPSHVDMVNEQGYNMVKVIGITGTQLLELINRPEIDMMKIDVEGATYNVLKGFGDNLRVIKFLHIEAEDVQIWEKQHLIQEVVDLMKYYGFEMLYTDIPYINQIDMVWKRID